MKVLYIIDTLIGVGGAERNLLQVSVGLKERGYKPIVFCLKGGALKNTLLENGIETVDLGLRKIYDFKAINTIFRLVKFVRKKRIDIIVTYHDGSDFLGLILAKLSGIPIISNRRDMGYSLKKRHILIYKSINSFFDSIIAVSNAVKSFISGQQKVDPQKIRVIYNGLDSSKFLIETNRLKAKEELGLNPHEPTVGCVANIRAIKGHKYFIEAAGRILEKIPDVKFLLIGMRDENGKNKCYEELIKIIKKKGIGKKVIFTGERNDIPILLSLVDISVIPSLSEGFSNTILESMAAGKPIVATNVGGNPEAVIDRKTGLLVPPADPSEMARAIISLLKDRVLAKDMGDAGKKRVEIEFSLDNLIKSHEELYEFVIEKHITGKKNWVYCKWLKVKGLLSKGIKILVSGILYYTGMIKAYLWIRRLLGKSIVKVLAYHNISDDYPTYLGISQTIRHFENQVMFAKENYHIVSLQEAVELLKKKKRFKNAIALTFDDCYKEFYTNIFPLMQKYNIPATFFLTVGPIQTGIPLLADLLVFGISNTEKLLLDLTPFGLKKYLLNTPFQKEEAIYEINEHLKNVGIQKSQDLIKEIYCRLGLSFEDVKKMNIILNWQDIDRMRNTQICFGSHTINHPNLVAIPLKKASEEIKKSKEIIEEKIGSKISFFAYPYGGRKDINNDIINLARSVGFLGAVTLNKISSNNFNPFLLPRSAIDKSMSLGFRGTFSKSLFAAEISGLSDYLFLRFLKLRNR